jgi:hypothetical protein
MKGQVRNACRNLFYGVTVRRVRQQHPRPFFARSGLICGLSVERGGGRSLLFSYSRIAKQIAMVFVSSSRAGIRMTSSLMSWSTKWYTVRRFSGFGYLADPATGIRDIPLFSQHRTRPFSSSVQVSLFTAETPRFTQKFSRSGEPRCALWVYSLRICAREIFGVGPLKACPLHLFQPHFNLTNHLVQATTCEPPPCMMRQL